MEKNCNKKTICQHSKPYWNKTLSLLSDELRIKQKTYLYRNTDKNLKEFQESKSKFEDARKKACQQFIMQETANLSAADAGKFWKKYKRLFKPASDTQIEALSTSDGTILTDNKDIESEMFDTFFRGKHIDNNKDSFDSNFEKATEDQYAWLKQNNFPKKDGTSLLSHNIIKPITLDEVITSIKSYQGSAKSFDNAFKIGAKCTIFTDLSFQQVSGIPNLDLGDVQSNVSKKGGQEII